MNIGYLCMDPNASLARPSYAPTIHMTATMRSLEHLGYEVAPLLYGDKLGPSESALRGRVKATDPPAALRWLRRLGSDALLAGQDLFRDRRLVESFLIDNDIAVAYERLYQPRSIVSRVASRLAVPHVVESNSPAEERQAYWGSPLHGLIKRKEIAILRRAAAVVAISSPLRDHYVSHGVSPSKIHVIPNGVDTERFSPGATERDVRSELDLGERLVIGFVGNIHPYHGAGLFVPLAERLQAERTDAVLLIVGAGPGLPDLENALAAAGLQGSVVTTGSVPHAEVPAYIDAMDIGLLPDFSWYGSAMKLLEYAAMGTTVVAPDLDNVGDVFTHGETAYLFRQGDTNALVAAVWKLADNGGLRRQLGEEGQRHVVSNHTWELNGRRIAQILETMAT